MEEGKKVRFFTYWERVNNIDLSVIELFERDGEFRVPWTTSLRIFPWYKFSGRETLGYYGGSEYYDIDLQALHEQRPGLSYLLFCDIMHTATYRGTMKKFSECICRAGYMMRDINNSEEAYEPKTAPSAFPVNCESTSAYLFAVDLQTNELVWLNMAVIGAGTEDYLVKRKVLEDCFETSKILSFADFLEIGASEVTDDPYQADIVFSDRDYELPENTEQIYSFDIDGMIAKLKP